MVQRCIKGLITFVLRTTPCHLTLVKLLYSITKFDAQYSRANFSFILSYDKKAASSPHVTRSSRSNVGLIRRAFNPALG